MKSIVLQTLPLSRIKMATYNPRRALKPGDPDYERLRNSVMTFGMVDPLIWNKRTGNLVGGHQRMAVLQDIGAKEVEVSVVDLDDQKEKALNVALNKIGGDWDFPKLKELLVELDDGEFDIEITGFDRREFEKMLGSDGVTQEERYPDMELQAFEHYDYIVLFFKNSMDFLKACNKFDIKKVGSYESKKGKIGLGRVVDGNRIVKLCKSK